jgi:hypothetical protein
VLTRSAAPLAALLLLLTGSAASSDPIGPDCDTCQGGIYTLEYDPIPVATGAGTTTWEITLSVNSAAYTGGGTHIDTVAIKPASSVVATNLVGAPSALPGWSELAGGLNANGCSGAGSGLFCTEANPTGSGPAVGGVDQWVFHVEVADAVGLFLDLFEASIKVRYVEFAEGSWSKVGDNVSENITLQVPEPTTLLLLSSGLVGLALAGTRRS